MHSEYKIIFANLFGLVFRLWPHPFTVLEPLHVSGKTFNTSGRRILHVTTQRLMDAESPNPCRRTVERALAKHICEKESKQDMGLWHEARVIFM